MLTREQNNLLTQTGPGTPGGRLLRRYWQPVALAEEMPAGGAPIPVRLLGEDLALFRDDRGRLGLVGLRCPHRGADLSYGHHLAYPCQEVGGIIFAYLGPGEPPLLPAYEFLTAPEEHRFVSKALHECNYLQGNEGNIDPAHLSFLHRLHREGAGWARATPVLGPGASSNPLFARDPAPTLQVEETTFGLRIIATRKAGPGESYLRVSNFILPNLAAFPGGGGGDGYSVNWHVPIDDVTHWKYTITFRRTGALAKDLPSYLIHDACATEGMGPIQDRTRERLGSTDRAIVAARYQLLRAVRQAVAGEDPPHVIRDPADNRFPDLGAVDMVIPDGTNWSTCWQEILTRGAAGRGASIPMSGPAPTRAAPNRGRFWGGLRHPHGWG